MESNAIGLIQKDMRRHQVEVMLPGEERSQKLFLVEITAKTNRLEELPLVYGEKVTPLHRKIAEKIFGDQESENVYGVFIDNDFRQVFAFNRAFADYSRENKRVEYKELDDILVEKIDPMAPVPRTVPSFISPRDRGRGGGPHTLIKYSLSEKQAEE